MCSRKVISISISILSRLTKRSHSRSAQPIKRHQRDRYGLSFDRRDRISILERGCLVFIGQSIDKYEDDVFMEQHLGKPAFDKMVQSLRFLTPEEMAFCKTAPRDTYGFSPEDPIAVGNSNLYDGREREELYLLTLRGPDGEEIIFQRQSPIFNQNGEIVDPYQIQYGSSPTTTLYFTIYRYQEPLYLPIGYSCEAAFPLSDPKP